MLRQIIVGFIFLNLTSGVLGQSDWQWIEVQDSYGRQNFRGSGEMYLGESAISITNPIFVGQQAIWFGTIVDSKSAIALTCHVLKYMGSSSTSYNFSLTGTRYVITPRDKDWQKLVDLVQDKNMSDKQWINNVTTFCLGYTFDYLLVTKPITFDPLNFPVPRYEQNPSSFSLSFPQSSARSMSYQVAPRDPFSSDIQIKGIPR